MFKEILKIIPQLDNSALAKMENSLATRFKRVAKGFGKGLMTTLKGGAVLGAISFLANKLLSPLKETQEAIDRALLTSKDLQTAAQEFNTTSGKLLRLQSLAKSAGLQDTGKLTEALAKFQTKLAEAERDPNMDTSVRAFVGQKDIVDAFFGYVQGLKQLSPEDQIVARKEVFGDAPNQAKFFSFLQADFEKVLRELGPNTSKEIDKAASKLTAVADLTNRLTARREIDDLVNKSRVITPNMAIQKDRQEREILKQENNRIKSYESLIAMDIAVKQMQNKLEEVFSLLAGYAPQLLEVLNRALGYLTTIATRLSDIWGSIQKAFSSGSWRRWFGGGD